MLISLLKGKTKQVENIQFQKEPTQVYMYFIEPQDLVIEEDEDAVSDMFISSIDMSDDPAREEYILAKILVELGQVDELYSLHAERFSRLWNMGRVETDNFELQQNIISCYYYILSSLPAPDHFGKLNQFYGLSPGSLSRGSLDSDYQGHSFWDTGCYLTFLRLYLSVFICLSCCKEIWMFPSILMFYPESAKSMLSYRIFTKNANAYSARLYNNSGWRLVL